MKSATKDALGFVAAVLAVRGGINAATLTAAQASTSVRAIVVWQLIPQERASN